MNTSFVLYRDLKTITDINPDTINEEFVDIPAEGTGPIGRYVSDLSERAYSDILKCRKGVFEKLQIADAQLKETNPDLQLMVVYGYRSLENQKKYFEIEMEKAKDLFDDEDELYEYVHEKIAVPTVAGHPTGGALDVVIFNMKKQEIVDFDAQVHDFDSEKVYALAEVNPVATVNRKLLRTVMMDAGFAPYDGEWWHFSYGDKEWAFYYKKAEALYAQVSTAEVFGL